MNNNAKDDWMYAALLKSQRQEAEVKTDHKRLLDYLGKETTQEAIRFLINAQDATRADKRHIAELEAENARLRAACKAAIPYLRDHIGLTLDDGPGDRIALDLCEVALGKELPQTCHNDESQKNPYGELNIAITTYPLVKPDGE